MKTTDLARVRNAVLAVSAFAWILLLVEHGGMAIHVHGGVLAMNPPFSVAANWLLMLAAMMLPALIPHIHHLRVHSFRRRRTRTTALFLAGYAAVWIGIGCLLLTVVIGAKLVAAHSVWPAALAGLLALIWQSSPVKQRCLNRCHSHSPLAAFGFAADWTALQFGATHGLWCAGSCWAWMLFPMLLPKGHTIAMAAATLLIFSERLEPPTPPRWAWRGSGRLLRLCGVSLRVNPSRAAVSN